MTTKMSREKHGRSLAPSRDELAAAFVSSHFNVQRVWTSRGLSGPANGSAGSRLHGGRGRPDYPIMPKLSKRSGKLIT
jgi:hypothetical protein